MAPFRFQFLTDLSPLRYVTSVQWRAVRPAFITESAEELIAGRLGLDGC